MMRKNTNSQTIIGIDYGSKLAGTTVIARVRAESTKVQFVQSLKKKDADQFILDQLASEPPTVIFLDAPLSLPAAYFGKGDDYFYRSADRELKAMSPMFLGGLTARAMRLKKQLNNQGHQVIEAYPGGLARHLALPKDQYKKQKIYLPSILELITTKIPIKFVASDLITWHHVDALLACWTGWRYHEGIAENFGIAEEGQIWI